MRASNLRLRIRVDGIRSAQLRIIYSRNVALQVRDASNSPSENSPSTASRIFFVFVVRRADVDYRQNNPQNAVRSLISSSLTAGQPESPRSPDRYYQAWPLRLTAGVSKRLRQCPWDVLFPALAWGSSAASALTSTGTSARDHLSLPTATNMTDREP